MAARREGGESVREAARDAWRRTRDAAGADRGGSRRRRERPKPLWGSFPLSEIAIGIGAMAVVVGFLRGPSDGRPALVAGIGLCTLAVLEVAAREHLTGYRSHSLLLALLATAPFQLVMFLLTGGFWAGLVAAVGDAALFATLALLLHRTFKRARVRADAVA